MAEQFPNLRAVVLQDGHIDRITGPRCIVKMREGPNGGLYQIAESVDVLKAGTEVTIDYFSRRAVKVGGQ